VFDLTIRRQRLLSVLSERTYFNRVEGCAFLNPDLDEPNLVMSASDQKSLELLAEAGLVEAQKETMSSASDKPRFRWLYRRTEKGTQLLEILGIEPEG